MTTYSVSRKFGWEGKVTDKVTGVCRMFGLTIERLKAGSATHECSVNLNDGDIVYITGPSGSGKSVLLRELEKVIPSTERVNLDAIALPADKSVIDCVDDELVSSLKLLSVAGLNDVFCILNQPANLSDGQKYRFRLARAMALKKKFIFADEFCSMLDRITAAVIAYNIHKFAKRNKVTFILASAHDDILLDLAPDVLIVKELSGPSEIIYKETKRKVLNAEL